MTDSRAEPGSFRDPHSRVFYTAAGVHRAFTAAGWDDLGAARASGLLDRDDVIGTYPSDADPPTDLLPGPCAGVVRHDRVPFISYPYEWPFSALKAAALTHLDLLRAAVAHGLILKDSSPYNVQLVEGRPVFIDVGSFESFIESELWVGYRQFCMLYLYPLLLTADRGLDPQAWLRGAIDGITPAQMRAVMSARDMVRRGRLRHVFLQAYLERHAGSGPRSTPRSLARPGVGREIVLANVRKMQRLVRRLRWNARSAWTDYEGTSSYSAPDTERKDAFVGAVVEAAAPRLVLDLGCNTGRHARIAAAPGRTVVAVDSDHACVELLWEDLQRRPAAGPVLPLVMDVADPSPALGWRGRERRTLAERGAPDLVLALALVHHLAITRSIPLAEIVGWLADHRAPLVVEAPHREDPMVVDLLARRRAGLNDDYDVDRFAALLARAGRVVRSERLSTRTLFHVVPESGSSCP